MYTGIDEDRELDKQKDIDRDTDVNLYIDISTAVYTEHVHLVRTDRLQQLSSWHLLKSPTT